MEIKSDIQIAQEAHLENIKDVAAKVGVTEDELEMYGKYKAKLSDELIHRVENNEDGKLVLITAINPTPAGEGKVLSLHLSISRMMLRKLRAVLNVVWYLRTLARFRKAIL